MKRNGQTEIGIDELISEAFFKLINSAEHYQKERGEFSSLAGRAIRRGLSDYILNSNGSIGRERTRMAIRGEGINYCNDYSPPVSVEDRKVIVERVNKKLAGKPWCLNKDEIESYESGRGNVKTKSYNVSVKDRKGNETQMVYFLKGNSPRPEDECGASEVLENLLKDIQEIPNERNREIFYLSLIEGLTQAEIATYFEIDSERVRQILRDNLGSKYPTRFKRMKTYFGTLDIYDKYLKEKCDRKKKEVA